MNAVDIQFCNFFVKVEQCFSLLFKLTTDPPTENHGRAIQKLSEYIKKKQSPHSYCQNWKCLEGSGDVWNDVLARKLLPTVLQFSVLVLKGSFMACLMNSYVPTIIS